MLFNRISTQVIIEIVKIGSIHVFPRPGHLLLVTKLPTEDRALSVDFLENARLQELPARLGLILRLLKFEFISDIERYTVIR